MVIPSSTVLRHDEKVIKFLYTRKKSEAKKIKGISGAAMKPPNCNTAIEHTIA
jgi:hypothetical protein